MAASEVEISNSALMLLGQRPIISLEDSTDAARLCKQFFALTRDEVLAECSWNFAIKRVKLAKLATTPLWDYAYAYQLPADTIRVLETDSNTAPWKREGSEILSDADPLSIRYIAQITDVPKFTPLFVAALEARLASKIAYPIMKDRTLEAEIFKLYMERLQTAKSLDGQEGTQDQVTNTIFLDARN